jgi:beta-carotene 3-hydroxylase
MVGVVVAMGSFVLMEPITYLTHRFVMHGPAARIHASHHRRGRGWEANDAFPIAFASLAMLATLASYQGLLPGWVVPAVAGVATYGFAYALVHDLYIHRRLPLAGRGGRVGGERPRPVLDRLVSAHQLHHRFGGEPYGMLLPIVPPSVWRRAQASATAPAERIDVVPSADLAKGLEAGEQLLAVPALGPRATDDFPMGGVVACEGVDGRA